MSQFAVEVDNLSKEFKIHHEVGKSARQTLTETFRAGLRRAYTSLSTRTDLGRPEIESFWALKDISFKVEKGSRLGLIGRNGAGKSTLLKILSRIMEPTSGQATIRGRQISLLEVGVGFHPELTGRENIYLNGALLGMKKAEVRAKFDEILDFAEIGPFLDTPVKRYSSGMYMKLAFAVAAHLEPEILIVDEALAVGDAQFQRKCLGKMEDISKGEGRTVIFVSHNIEAIRTLCTDGLFLENGRLIAHGDIKDVTETYVNTFSNGAARFIPNRHKPVYFNDVKLGAPEVRFGDDLIVSCEISSNHYVKRYTIGIGIFNLIDIRVASVLLNSDRPLEKGLNCFSIRIPIKSLIPGEYKLAIAISFSEIIDLQDVIMGYPLFTVLSDDRNAALFSKWHDSWGNTVLDGSNFI